MNFSSRAEVAPTFAGKTVAIVGSGPGVMENPKHRVDSHDVVVRVNNYKLFPQTGRRTDVFYSFFGNSIRKRVADLRHDGVRLCMCKCPDAQFIESAWHRARGKMIGVDFRWIYVKRAAWWFCPVYVPSVEEFRAHFALLGGHVPTTGFAALLDVLSFNPGHVYLTGFDFFLSRTHNVNERWKAGDPDDPIGHDPAAERAWLAANLGAYPIALDEAAREALEGRTKFKMPLPRRSVMPNPASKPHAVR
jgi:hypothetical protein